MSSAANGYRWTVFAESKESIKTLLKKFQIDMPEAKSHSEVQAPYPQDKGLWAVTKIVYGTYSLDSESKNMGLLHYVQLEHYQKDTFKESEW